MRGVKRAEINIVPICSKCGAKIEAPVVVEDSAMIMELRPVDVRHISPEKCPNCNAVFVNVNVTKFEYKQTNLKGY